MRVILVHPLLGSPVSTICKIIKYGVWACFSTSVSFQSSGLFIQSFFTTSIRLVVFLDKTKYELFVILILHDWIQSHQKWFWSMKYIQEFIQRYSVSLSVFEIAYVWRWLWSWYLKMIMISMYFCILLYSVIIRCVFLWMISFI